MTSLPARLHVLHSVRHPLMYLGWLPHAKQHLIVGSTGRVVHSDNEQPQEGAAYGSCRQEADTESYWQLGGWRWGSTLETTDLTSHDTAADVGNGAARLPCSSVSCVLARVHPDRLPLCCVASSGKWGLRFHASQEGTFLQASMNRTSRRQVPRCARSWAGG